MMQTDSVHSEGAELTFDTYDSGNGGTPLLLIPGGGGEADIYGKIASILASEFTVITYDRRCYGRSSGDATKDLDMAQQARDAVAVIRAAVKHERAIVFGNSAGAHIALAIASNHPECALLIMVHEPPTMSLLPDATEALAFCDKVSDTFDTQGALAAMKLFSSCLRGMSGPIAPLKKDVSFFFGKEFLNISRFVPDLATIRKANVVPVVLLVGELSDDAYYARSVPIIAEHLQCEKITMPGNHLAFLLEPQVFAEALSKVIAKFPKNISTTAN